MLEISLYVAILKTQCTLLLCVVFPKNSYVCVVEHEAMIVVFGCGGEHYYFG